MFVSCPYHASQKGLTALFDLESGSFYCFSCGTYKNAFELAKDQGVAKPKKSNKTSFYDSNYDPRAWEEYLRFPVNTESTYLHGRGLNKETIEKFQIREAPYGIVMPVGYHSIGEYTGVVIRNFSNKNVKYIKIGDIKPLMGADLYGSNDPVIVVENTFAFYIGHQQGYNTLLSFGTNLSIETASLIKKFTNVRGWFNNDVAGWKAGATLKGMHPNAKIIKFGDPDDIYDWSDYVDNFVSDDELANLYENAEKVKLATIRKARRNVSNKTKRVKKRAKK